MAKKEPLYPHVPKSRGPTQKVSLAMKKTWRVDFKGTFYRKGVDKLEAEHNAEEFLAKLLLLSDTQIISISEVAYEKP